jgi:hypothetical protein
LPEQWQIPVTRLPRYRLPVVVVRFSGSLEGTMIVASTEPSTCIVEDVVDHFGFALTMDRVPAAPRGRRVVPGDAGLLLAPIFRLRDLELKTADGGWLSLGPLTVAVTNRPRVLGVGGLLGVDVLARFRRIQFDLGPPDDLLLERDD